VYGVSTLGESTPGVGMRRFAARFGRARWRIVAVAAAVAAMAWLAVLLIPQRYDARAGVYLDLGAAAGPELHERYSARVEALRFDLLAPAQLEKMAARADLDERRRRALAGRMRVDSPAPLHLAISHHDSDPHKARAAVEAALAVLREADLGAGPARRNGAGEDALARRIADYEAKIARNEAALAALKAARGAAERGAAPSAGRDLEPGIERNGAGNGAAPTSPTSPRVQAGAAAELRRTERALADARARMTDLLNWAVAVSPPRQGGDILRWRLRLSELRRDNPPDAADILTAQARIAQLEAAAGLAADDAHARLGASLQASLDEAAALKARRDALRGQTSAGHETAPAALAVSAPDPVSTPVSVSSAPANPPADEAIRRLANERRALEAAHAALAALRDETEISDGAFASGGGPSFAVAQPLAVSPGPSRLPLVFGGLGLAVAAGLLAGGAAAVLDDRFPDEAALARAAGFPVLGSVAPVPSAAVVSARRRGRMRLAAAWLGLLIAGAACAWFVSAQDAAAPVTGALS